MTAALVGSPLLSATAGPSVVGAVGAGGIFSAGTAFASVGKFFGSSLLSGLMTGAGAYGQYQAGLMQADILNMQARQAELNARMETIKGRQAALNISKNLEKDLAAQNAIFASRGVLQGEGTALAASEASKENAQADIDIAMFGGAIASESDKLRAAQYGAEAGAAKSTGITNALSSATTLLEGL